MDAMEAGLFFENDRKLAMAKIHSVAGIVPR
jgi:hypothetical protein